MALQAKSQMKFTLNWIIVNLTDLFSYLGSPCNMAWVLGYRPEFFRSLFWISYFSLSGLLAHCAPPPSYTQGQCSKEMIFLSGKASLTYDKKYDKTTSSNRGPVCPRLSAQSPNPRDACKWWGVHIPNAKPRHMWRIRLHSSCGEDGRILCHK